jgi:hypothetical protein
VTFVVTILKALKFIPNFFFSTKIKFFQIKNTNYPEIVKVTFQKYFLSISCHFLIIKNSYE